jgi:hypothetical protein
VFSSRNKHAFIQVLQVSYFQAKSTATVSRIKQELKLFKPAIHLIYIFCLLYSCLKKKVPPFATKEKALAFVIVSYTKSPKFTIIQRTSYSEAEATLIRQNLFSQICLQPLKLNRSVPHTSGMKQNVYFSHSHDVVRFR